MTKRQLRKLAGATKRSIRDLRTIEQLATDGGALITPQNSALLHAVITTRILLENLPNALTC